MLNKPANPIIASVKSKLAKLAEITIAKIQEKGEAFHGLWCNYVGVEQPKCLVLTQTLASFSQLLSTHGIYKSGVDTRVDQALASHQK